MGLATAVVPKRRRDAAALYDYPIARSTFGAHGRSQDYEDFALYEQFFEGQHSGDTNGEPTHLNAHGLESWCPSNYCSGLCSWS